MTTAVQEDIGCLLAVVLDRAHARFFEVTDAGVTELPGFRSPAMRGGRFHSDRQGSPGWGEHAYHGRIREEERRHVAAVVERLLRLDRERRADALLIAGVGGAVAALALALPPVLADRLVATTRLNPTEVTPAAVARTARLAQKTRESATEEELLATLEEALGTGRATNGARETLRALAKGQVHTLIVAANVRATGFRCARSQRLVLSAADCLEEGEPVPVSDLLSEATAEARRQHAAVVTIRRPNAAGRVDGIAALLRFS